MDRSTQGRAEPTRVNDKTPDGFEGWDWDSPFGTGGVAGDPYYVQAHTSYDGPFGVPAWSCKTCGAIVLHDSVDRHRQFHTVNRVGIL